MIDNEVCRKKFSNLNLSMHPRLVSPINWLIKSESVSALSHYWLMYGKNYAMKFQQFRWHNN